VNVSDVRKAIAAALAPISEELNVNPYAAAQPVAPGIQIIPPGVAYDYSFQRELDEWTFVIQGFVALTDEVASQALLDELCTPGGPASVKDLIEADRTLGGTVATLRVLDQSPGRMVERAGSGPMLLVEWRLQVFAKGD
jgi:hypothetical protein